MRGEKKKWGGYSRIRLSQEEKRRSDALLFSRDHIVKFKAVILLHNISFLSYIDIVKLRAAILVQNMSF
jgi:hypothetical protein